MIISCQPLAISCQFIEILIKIYNCGQGLLSVDLEKMPTYIDVIKFENEAPANTIRLKCRSRNLLPTTFETYSENFVNRQLLIPLGKTQCIFLMITFRKQP